MEKRVEGIVDMDQFIFTLIWRPHHRATPWDRQPWIADKTQDTIFSHDAKAVLHPIRICGLKRGQDSILKSGRTGRVADVPILIQIAKA
ncbi:MAG: hypothetical protein V7695_20170, partial [Sulfitobacter sp.]